MALLHPGGRVKAWSVLGPVGKGRAQIHHSLKPTVAESSASSKPHCASSAYLGSAFFKTFDDFLLANSELERFVSVSG